MIELLYHPESDCYFTGEPDDVGQTVAIEPHNIPAGTQLQAGLGVSSVLPDMDFETYSEAGYLWNEQTGKYDKPKGSTKFGLFAVGAAVYAQHPSTEVISLAYDLKDGIGPRLWLPGMPPPQELFDYIARGGLVEAWNCSFEFWIWEYVCKAKMGWPDLPFWQLRDAMAKSRAHAYPGALGNAARVSNVSVQKQPDGKRLINKFSIPRKPTKKDPRRRIRPIDDLPDAQNFYDYNIDDIRSEAMVSAVCPDLPQAEVDYWLCTFAMNRRGFGLDMDTINAAATILDTALQKYNHQLQIITHGQVEAASEVTKLINWLRSQGVHTDSLDNDACELMLGMPLPEGAKRAIEIRQLIGSAGVKKLYAMQRMCAEGNRAHDQFMYHAARTGRDGGQDIQPQNLVKAGPKLIWCQACGKPHGTHRTQCPYCDYNNASVKPVGWSWKAVDHAAEILRTGRLRDVDSCFGDAVLTISGCIRGMITAADGKDLICSDYSSIEAVVTAVLAGEQWRVEAFERKEDIYLVSASRITGTPMDEYLAHPDGPKGHPDRQKVGKPAELGLGFGGWLGAWRQFDSSDTFTDEEVKKNITAWRDASPNIVEFWGGQVRGKPWKPDSYELFGLEGCAIAAVQNPGKWYSHGLISYVVHDDKLFCMLPSGRYLTYHKPRLAPSSRWENQLELSFEGWNSNPQMGAIGWIRIQTYGGRLSENCIQGTARDIMAFAVPNLERAGYPCVLRVHDEIIAEIPKGFGSIEEFETIMATMPPWAQGWPVRASGGWRGLRYRKD